MVYAKTYKYIYLFSSLFPRSFFFCAFVERVRPCTSPCILSPMLLRLVERVVWQFPALGCFHWSLIFFTGGHFMIGGGAFFSPLCTSHSLPSLVSFLILLTPLTPPRVPCGGLPSRR
ncbi:hypothetical protein TRSC58_07566 [Trypanosoma rangeli SC58]|uniref:Uncharacterized protein n=1 Tax=Trypanosoma rangeli SC58 TaxID=429131 RepID=A0A061IRK1_TRYRA|nr:hypothetical protein TRSC58_07566 [Trypanosoma rangeli SC58]